MLYVLDEPSVGLHPSNVEGLRQDDRRPGRERQLRRDRGARAGAHPRRGLGHRARPGRRGARRHHRRRGHPGPARRPTRARSSARSWPARPPSAGTGPRHPAPAGRSAIEVADLYNLHGVTAAFPLHRLTALAGRPAPGRPPSSWTAWSRPRRAHLNGSAAARPRPRPRPGRHPPGRPDRRLAYRAERAVDAGHLLRGLRPHPPPVRRVAPRPATEMEARSLLVQHPRGPVPDLPRPRRHRPGRAVPARHHRRVPDLPRRPLQRRDPGGPRRRPDHR